MSEQLKLSAIEVAVDAIAQGQIIIVMDDEHRENEGDFIILAEKATKEDIKFMMREGRGLICVPIRAELSEKLNLGQ